MEAYCKISAVITAFGDVFGDFPVIRFFFEEGAVGYGFSMVILCFFKFFLLRIIRRFLALVRNVQK